MNAPTPPPICANCGERPAKYEQDASYYCAEHVPPLRMKIIGTHPHSGETGTLHRSNTAMQGKMAFVELDDCQHGHRGCYVERENVQPLDTKLKAAM